MRKNLYVAEEEHSSGASTSSLFVSLYLVVLAFFILLNSIAKINESNSSTALHSVRDSFSNLRHDKDLPYIESMISQGGVVSFQNYMAPVAKVVRDSVTLLDTEIIEQGNHMQIKIPVKNFFINGEPYIKPEQGDFMRRLVEELNKIDGGEKIYAEFIIEFPKDLEDANSSLEIARAGAFARRMQDLGMNGDIMSIGLKPMYKSQFFYINFYPRQEVNTQQTDQLKDVEAE